VGRNLGLGYSAHSNVEYELNLYFDQNTSTIFTPNLKTTGANKRFEHHKSTIWVHNPWIHALKQYKYLRNLNIWDGGSNLTEVFGCRRRNTNNFGLNCTGKRYKFSGKRSNRGYVCLEMILNLYSNPVADGFHALTHLWSSKTGLLHHIELPGSSRETHTLQPAKFKFVIPPFDQ
jgi:hypothetical protein